MQATAAISNHSELRGRIVAYLAEHTVLSLATAGPAGLWAAPIMYVHDGTTLYFTSVAATRHGVNMEATNLVVGTINNECRTWPEMKGLQIEGRVERVTEIGERRRVIRAYLEKFPFGAGLWNGQSDADVIALDPGIHNFYRVTPTKVLFTDNEHAPGVREELPVE